jgi:predicted enzyme related to lactoylglutathione lyase
LDAERLQGFYRDVFGWQRRNDMSIGDYAVSTIGSGALTAATGPVPDWVARSHTFYIQVTDIEQTLRQIEVGGGSAVMPRTVGPAFGAEHIEVFTKFVDPAGNVVGLVESPGS